MSKVYYFCLFLTYFLNGYDTLETSASWDSFCQLQPRKGSCGNQLKRFYYDMESNECRSFYFGGCDGNQNNFNTLLECERFCKDSKYLNIDGSRRVSPCNLQPETGFCLALINMYYYDINEKKCKIFKYGGCGGNDNKFRTRALCMRACKNV
ncbi:actinia tenebrosa protease inhibitors-like [Danaus plexippus]|uniref:Kunitz protease inhibitor n=1 Tax=Danaus plexippus plexippus TaxID=278856 RepID=A0A212FDH9_DANPL|nr:actinia tenebrosa protease inhibitors-like [Danaus plexippus]OWR51782.1 Kunitz protease inhibitor [Danaus plexippus plexippus]